MGFTCPFCQRIVALESATHRTYRISFWGSVSQQLSPDNELSIKWYRCPECRKETVIVDEGKGQFDGIYVNVEPRSSALQFPDYVPTQICNDYQEACAIINDSPKAAATLLRRCLQGMIRDFWNVKEDTLYKELNAIQSKVPANQWKAIDALRKIGNIGAHMEKDVSLIIDVDSDEAMRLISLIEILLKQWYVNRHEQDELYKSISDIGDEKTRARNYPLDR